VQPFRADLVEAYVTLGRLDEAAAALGELEVRLAGGAHARAGAQRVRGLVAAARGDDDTAEQAFTAGLDGDEQATGPFVWARLLLAAGAFARRRGQRRTAADRLDGAIERFAALGAEPWLRRAEQERAASGLSPRRGGHAPATLTKAEIAVAELVAAGHTNREVANRLIVSPRTVETHLARVFMKLGVRSRTELANAWRKPSPEDV
jgi:DNA-binding CsgD family transcriptional regulator